MPSPFVVHDRPWDSPLALPNTRHLTYQSPVDGLEDWALACPGHRPDWVIHLHGHGSTGDQPFRRDDLRTHWLPRDQERGVGILSPHLRGNNWMAPAAASDLRHLLEYLRTRYNAQRYILLSGSMGGTGSLIFSALYPDVIDAVIALCPATDLSTYHAWLNAHPGGVQDEIRGAIESAYGGTPSTASAAYEAHSALRQAHRLTMPLLVIHGDADELIPIAQARQLADALAGPSHVTLHEIPGGGHDAPLPDARIWTWLDAFLAPSS